MSVGGTTYSCGTPPREVLAGSQCSPQQTPVDQVDNGGSTDSVVTEPVQSPVPKQAETSFEGGGDTDSQDCGSYVQPAPAPDPVACGTNAAVDAGGDDDTTSTSSPSPTVAPDAVDPNTGQPLNPTTTTSTDTPPDPVPVVEAPAPAPVTEGPMPAAPTAGTPTTGPVAPVDPSAPTGQTPYGPQGPAAVGPATSLPSWPQWHQAFLGLGVDAENIARIGGQNMSNQQLALVYMTIRRELDAARGEIVEGTKPGTPGQPGTGGWSPDWEQKFTALLGPNGAEQVAQIRELAKQNGADDATLQALYDRVAASIQGQGTTPVDPNALTWTPEVEKAFADLGMPTEFIEAYKQALAANPAGIQAAYNFAAERIGAFKELGYYDQLKAEGVTDVDIWATSVLAEKLPTAAELKTQVEALHANNAPMWQKALQFGINFFPGGELVQYALGRKLVTGESIDQGNPLNLLMAGLSGLAAFTAFRGVANIRGGWKAVQAGLPNLTKAGSVEQAVDGALLTTVQPTLKNKILSFIPFTAQHKAITGWNVAEAAAGAHLAAAPMLGTTKEGALQVATANQWFDDLKTVQTIQVGDKAITTAKASMSGGSVAYLGNIGNPFNRSASAGANMKLETKGPLSVLTVNKSFAGDGKQALVGMLEQSGDKFRNPAWLQSQGGAFVDDLAKIPDADLPALGQLMAADAAVALKVTQHSNPIMSVLGKLKPGATEHFAKLSKNVMVPDWFTNLAKQTTAEAAQMASNASKAAVGAAAAGGAAVVGGEVVKNLGLHADEGAALLEKSPALQDAGFEIISRRTRPVLEASNVEVPRLAGQRHRDILAGKPFESFAPRRDLVDTGNVIAGTQQLDEIAQAAGQPQGYYNLVDEAVASGQYKLMDGIPVRLP